MRRLVALIPVFLLTVLPLSSSAYAVDPAADKAKDFVEVVGNEALAILQSKSGKAAQQNKLEKMILQHVDIDWIGKFVMGRYWRQATDAQKAAYLKNYRNFIASSYASRFTEYKGDGFEITDAKKDESGGFVIKMKIKTDKQPVLVDYKVHNEGGKLKIYDLYVEGVSLITTQRSEFSSIVQNKGIDYLIQQLGDKTSQLRVAQSNK